MILAGTGIRVNELVNLKVEDVGFDTGYLEIEVAKGSRPRTVVCPPNALEALSMYLMGRMVGYVFEGRSNGHITTRQVERLLDEIAIRAGLQDKHGSRKRITPHLLRHSAACWYLDAGVPVSDVQGQLGHRSLETTGKYLERRPNHRKASFERAGIDKIL